MQDKLDEHLEKEAKYHIASSYLKQKDTPAAFEWFSQIANEVNTEMGAEAKYMLAEISYERGDVELAEEHIFKFIDMNTPHQYWMGKSFLLLADVYLSKGDDFQAVQTLESIINYYTVETDGIKSAAVLKKKEITGRVDSENQADEQEQLEIEMN
jgi:TolA-binding protein